MNIPQVSQKQEKSFFKKAGFLIGFVTASQLAGVVGSVFTAGAVDTWYKEINRPPFTPPDWLFAPVWISLYVLMGISAYLIWNKGLKTKGVQAALMVFFVQLVLNSLWSILFFGLNWILIAFLEILVLWIAIFIMIYKFYPLSRTAALIQIPYILWVSFAAILNFSFAVLNTF
ncbi:MAG: tryptophan-rich sensory protein [Candidatus Aminicenantes bacterium]|nr:tryptophan-rich sensory protein [Candidatus Aminicenantes bacterium]